MGRWASEDWLAVNQLGDLKKVLLKMVFFGLQDAKSQRLLKFTLDTWQYLGPVALRNADFTETFVGAVGEQLGPFIVVHRVVSIVL